MILHVCGCETDDVGVYFEANGHGTVLFSQAAMDAITSASMDSASDEQRKSITDLRNILDVINQTVCKSPSFWFACLVRPPPSPCQCDAVQESKFKYARLVKFVASTTRVPLYRTLM